MHTISKYSLIPINKTDRSNKLTNLWFDVDLEMIYERRSKNFQSYYIYQKW